MARSGRCWRVCGVTMRARQRKSRPCHGRRCGAGVGGRGGGPVCGGDGLALARAVVERFLEEAGVHLTYPDVLLFRERVDVRV